MDKRQRLLLQKGDDAGMTQPWCPIRTCAVNINRV